MSEYRITVNDKTYSVTIGRIEDNHVEVMLGDRSYTVEIETPHKKSMKTPRIDRGRAIPDASAEPDRTAHPGSLTGKGDITAPLPGAILKILVAVGDEVTEGQTVAIMEAMKMENEIESHIAGKVSKIAVKEGDTVLENALIMSIG